jgi:hypothetical protein
MRQPAKEHLMQLIENQSGPCISIYMATHRSHPENQRDPLTYKNLVKEMETSLLEKYPQSDVQELVQKFRAVEADRAFWNCRTEGLAILGSPEQFHILDLARRPKDLVVVADSFHIKPLLRILQSADRFHILYLNRQAVRLFEGNRDSLEEVDLSGIPATITEALGEELTDEYVKASSYGMRGSGAGDKAMFHGQGSRKDEIRTDTYRFFRAVDREILEKFSRPSGLPLMLAGVKEHHADFREVSHNPHLIDQGLMMDISALSMDELRTKAWQAMEPYYLERLQGLKERFQSAHADQQGSDALSEVVPAALDGRVAALLIEADRQIPGRIDAEARDVRKAELSDPETDDVLDDLAELVLRMDGEVIIVPPERMPRSGGLAAIYRY